MDKNLKYYLKSLGFSDNDILSLIENTPALQFIDYGDAIDNIMLVVAKGYPIDDIDSIIAINPAFLAEDPDVLRNKLKQIDNIAEQLKADPFLI